MLEFVWRYKWVKSMVDLFHYVLRMIASLLFVKLVKLEFPYVVYILLD